MLLEGDLTMIGFLKRLIKCLAARFGMLLVCMPILWLGELPCLVRTLSYLLRKHSTHKVFRAKLISWVQGVGKLETIEVVQMTVLDEVVALMNADP